MTPLLIFVGHRAGGRRSASVASHSAASSFSGAISYWRRRAIDPALARCSWSRHHRHRAPASSDFTAAALASASSI